MLEANIRKNIVNRKEIELIAKGIQDNNPGMAYQSAMEYAEKNVINKKKNQTILFIMPINYSYSLLDQIIEDSNVNLKTHKEFAEANKNLKTLNEKKKENDFGKSLNLFYSHPLGILYLAGVARTCGFNVEILDLHKNFCEMIWNKNIKHESIQNFLYDNIKEKILRHNPVLVSISCLFSMASEVAHDVAAFVKKIDTNSKVLMGGGYPTNSTKETLWDQNVDIVIVGEGEHAFKEIICSLDEYSPENYFHNPAIATRKSLDKKIKPVGDKIQDLDNLPYPAWDLFDKPMSYITGSNRTRSYDLKEKRCVSLYTSRGCPFYCTFCASHTIHGRKLRLHSLEHIFAEIDKLVKDYNINLLLIEDDIFNFNRQRTIEFCKGLIDRWGSRFEIEFPNGIYIPTLNDEVVQWLSRAGVKDVHIAVESGHQYTLTNIVKKGGLTLEKIKEAVNVLNKYDIIIRNFFIIGFPGETKEMIRKSLQFAADLNSDWTCIFIATPIHGSDLHRMAHEEGYLNNGKNSNSKLENTHYLRAGIETEDFTAKELEELQYDANLHINFINNRNLINKRYDRAEVLYGDVVRLYPDHLFANYCYWQSLVGQNKLEDSKIIENRLRVLLKNSINIKYVKKYNLYNKKPFADILSKREIELTNVETLVTPKWQLM
jgi:radical SAM superfamily enzyme YgiQ (UPF0313 family)